jgi:hypothetical protein
VLRNIGHTVTLLDLRPPALVKSRWSSPLAFLMRWHCARFVRRHCPPLVATTQSAGKVLGLAPEADVWVVGSDQVWNPEITGPYAADYFLVGAPAGAKRVAYAASFGSNTLMPWDTGFREKAREWLGAFDAISTREASGLSLLAKLGVPHATRTLDPTLLLGDFGNLLRAPAQPRKELVCMVLGTGNEFAPAIAALSRRLGLTPVILARRSPDLRIRAVPCPSIVGWIRRLHEAAFVVTNSFHGLAMALVFNKPFAVQSFDHPSFCRLRELTACIGLEDRIFEDFGELATDARWMKAVSYSEVNETLGHLRRESLEFLETHLPERESPDTLGAGS